MVAAVVVVIIIILIVVDDTDQTRYQKEFFYKSIKGNDSKELLGKCPKAFSLPIAGLSHESVGVGTLYELKIDQNMATK